MCGIVAAVARTDILPFLLEGLRRLEYRGYDSAGLAIAKQGKLEYVRTLGRVSELAQKSSGLTGQIGIAHTRWATHGAPAEHNAHPQICGGLAVVHNGIIENYEELRKHLETQGVEFSSQTDTEVVGHLISSYVLQGSHLLAAVQKAMKELDGTYALAVLSEKGEEVVLARHGAPLLLGTSDSGTYAASDAMALVGVTQSMMFLDDGDCAQITPKGVEIFNVAGAPVTRAWLPTPVAEEAVDLAGYRHFMQKEIFYQPQALAATLEGVASARSLSLEVFGNEAPQVLSVCRRVLILACGTSFHAGLVARYWIEELAGVPCMVEVASEYRYRTSVPDPATLVVAISQSGETADTLAAFRHAQKLGQAHALAICNVPTSSLIREAPLKFLTRAGTEVGVASTKAFTTQLAALFLLALALAKVHKRLEAKQEASWLKELRHVPQAVAAVLRVEEGIKTWAAEFAPRNHALFLGRGVHYPIALEGALKLKEISYIHAEAYPAGELKHGPLALVDGEMPVVAVAPNDALLVKLKGNLQEVQARGGRLYVLADAQSSVIRSEGCEVLRLPEHENRLSPIVHVVPLQLLAYHVAILRGTDVDKPRNLAKSVTVE